MATITIDQLIARRVKGGANEAESRALLAELTAALSGDNLAHALVYNGFATGTQADAFAASISVDSLIARHMAAGHSEEESRTQLAALVDAFGGDDFAAALVEDGFATADGARVFLEAGGDITVIETPSCRRCGLVSDIAATGMQADAFRAGAPVQEVFPGMAPEVREILISGTHPACWAQLVG
jgi:hypothetical protein